MVHGAITSGCLPSHSCCSYLHPEPNLMYPHTFSASFSAALLAFSASFSACLAALSASLASFAEALATAFSCEHLNVSWRHKRAFHLSEVQGVTGPMVGGRLVCECAWQPLIPSQ
jgi:hypothetical protein